jgi:DNA topoisomerase VI subunit A
MTRREALFILVVESVVTLVSLHSAGFERCFSCIIVTGSGVPDICSSRNFFEEDKFRFKVSRIDTC